MYLYINGISNKFTRNVNSRIYGLDMNVQTTFAIVTAKQ